MSIWRASLTDLEFGFKPKISGSRELGPLRSSRTNYVVVSEGLHNSPFVASKHTPPTSYVGTKVIASQGINS